MTTLLDLLLEKSERLEEALKARCYDPKLPHPPLKFTYRDSLLVGGSGILSVLLYLFTYRGGSPLSLDQRLDENLGALERRGYEPYRPITRCCH